MFTAEDLAIFRIARCKTQLDLRRLAAEEARKRTADTGGRTKDENGAWNTFLTSEHQSPHTKPCLQRRVATENDEYFRMAPSPPSLERLTDLLRLLTAQN